jgi:hypothetical protein
MNIQKNSMTWHKIFFKIIFCSPKQAPLLMLTCSPIHPLASLIFWIGKRFQLKYACDQ